jgi:16S rRNA (cytosine1402-N4)-methyltransferase
VPVDGILADLGVSSHQFDVAERGFSIRFSGELDLRMDRRQTLTAARVLNEYEEERLAAVFRDYGELHNGAALAAKIVGSRSEKSIVTFGDLRSVLARFAQPGRENKFFARVMQALRIEINNELEALKELLEQALQVLRPGGRLAVISYHSLEDRLVKHFMKTGNFDGVAEKDFFGNVYSPFKVITKKPVVPDSEEVRVNSRARSARLRVAEKQ